jgi:uncharacterized membrane protein
MNKSRAYAHGATISLLALITLCILEEMWLSPLRPGGSWLVLKVVPLFFSLRGVIKQDNYTMQWSSMLILLYFTEGIVRATSDPAVLSSQLGWLEVVLCLLFFYCTLSYLRPLKKIAKAAAKREKEREKEREIEAAAKENELHQTP